jgi:glycerol uptake facilitator-like aquaporin
MASDASALPLSKRVAAESVGTALLLATVVGSGIMGERLAGGNVAIALLANSLATGAVLIALILCFGSISGAHFNPAVSWVERMRGTIGTRTLAAYAAGQMLGALAGVVLAHAMFGEALVQQSSHPRAGFTQALSEATATFGLVAVILGSARQRVASVPFAVGLYITGAYWFTASTSFANPAVTIARAWTDTFAGIRPSDAPPFVAAQLFGAGLAAALFAWFGPREGDAAARR